MNRRRQPHRIPPPISHGAESLDAEIILQEFPDDVGLCLWKTVRSVRLWRELPENERRLAFSRDAYQRRLERLRRLSVTPDLLDSLETAATVLEGGDVHLEAVVTACRSIAAWADEGGAAGTALEFTQVAALLTPADAELIHAVARIARRRGEYARAESWYRQAIAVSRRTHDWISLAGAYLGLGSTFLLRGSHSAARQTLIRGVRAAERHSLREERALISHQLALVAIRTRRAAEVVRHGRIAFDSYGTHHPRLSALAIDLASFWVRSGHPSEGRQVLQRVLPEHISPAERLARAASLARASGALGDTDSYEAAWRDAAALLDDPQLSGDVADALRDLAAAAAAANDTARAQDAAGRLRGLAEALDAADIQVGTGPLASQSRTDGNTVEKASKKLSREGRRLAADLAGRSQAGK